MPVDLNDQIGDTITIIVGLNHPMIGIGTAGHILLPLGYPQLARRIREFTAADKMKGLISGCAGIGIDAAKIDSVSFGRTEIGDCVAAGLLCSQREIIVGLVESERIGSTAAGQGIGSVRYRYSSLGQCRMDYVLGTCPACRSHRRPI